MINVKSHLRRFKPFQKNNILFLFDFLRESVSFENDFLNLCKQSYNILMVTDFIYPSMGGVETHAYQLS
jgi:hypothetical protein